MTQLQSQLSSELCAGSDTLKVLAGRLFDPHSLKFIPSQTITTSKTSGIILSVETTTENDLDSQQIASGETLDLRHLSILPGFVDAHVHFFLHSYSETSWNDQNTTESLVERTIRATVHARKTLMTGFTTVRDLGTEGAEDADIALRKCLSGPNPLIPGPRYFCANRAIVCTGSYGPKNTIHVNQEGTEGVTGAEVADGVDGCIRATRRQIGAGADWIKIYANYRFRSRMQDVSPYTAGASLATFNALEMENIINTAHSVGVKVAAHATGAETISKLLELGIDSIEHGTDLVSHPDSLLRLLSASPNTTWVPTLAVHYFAMQLGEGKDPRANLAWKISSDMFKRAIGMGMENIACGGDTGAFSHGENAMEMKLMVRLGADWRKVLKWGTLGGWESIRPIHWETKSYHAGLGENDYRFGCVTPGWAADLVGVAGEFDKDFEGTVDDVQFVMKSGRVYKLNGREL
ncbi:hypothetical protein BDP27DRAFT_1271375 [Rhodocollybia butyracea]|uniref:Amidohydrolase-related domain-containing protein n=1 Tax=Rhodocollybia butyracea TaxID=206335 RepID=A0A9P5PIU1_9AGAR|nr:hypothetical protein BDP27DRAFT_1271375 [Rhodocollybia butyracea]